MDLYSLPKDMLVKLVSTIREDIIKEYEEKIKDLQDKLYIFKNVEPGKCSDINCKKTWVYHYDEFFEMQCELCRDTYCEDHIIYIDDGDYCLCNNCNLHHQYKIDYASI